MTEHRNPLKNYFKRKQPYFFKSVDNWDEWNTDESFDRTLFVGIDDTVPNEPPSVALYIVWQGKPVMVIGGTLYDTILQTLATTRQLEQEIQAMLIEIQRLAQTVAEGEANIVAAISQINQLQDACEELIQLANNSVELAKDWAVKMDGKVQDVDYSSKWYANKAGELAAPVIAMEDDIHTVSDIADDVAVVADNIDNIQRIRFGLRSISFVAADWVRVGATYQLQYDKDNLAVGIYKTEAGEANLVANVNIKRLENMNVLFAQAPFDGYMLVADRQDVTTFVYERGDASDTWVITHNMNRFPTVIVVDSDGNEIEKNTVWNSANQLTVLFNIPVAGKAYLN